MSNKLYFVNGQSIEITDEEMLNMVKRMRHMGVKTHRTKYCDPNMLIFFNSSTCTHMELAEEEFEQVIPQRKPVKREAVEPVVEEKVEEEPVEEKKETQQERNDRILAEMKEKSDCAGNKHEGKEQIIHYQDVMIKKKGAKPLQSRRYFPVCSFCGLRQKYVKADSLTEDQKENARPWVGVN